MTTTEITPTGAKKTGRPKGQAATWFTSRPKRVPKRVYRDQVEAEHDAQTEQRQAQTAYLANLLARVEAATSKFEKALQNAPDFETAVRIAAQRYAVEVRLARESVRPDDPQTLSRLAFWERQQDDAQTVLALLARLADVWKPTGVRQRALIALERAGLCWYWAALDEDTGKAYARELGF